MYTVSQKTGTLLFLRLLCVLLTNLKNIWQYCSKGNLQQNTHFKFENFKFHNWCVVFNCNPSRKHAKYGHCRLKHNAAKSDAKVSTTQFEMNAKHSKRRSDQMFKMSSTSFHTSLSIKNMTSTADDGKWRTSFRARVRCNAQFAAMSFCERRFFKHFNLKSDEGYCIPKSNEFMSLATFDVWFCDSLVAIGAPSWLKINLVSKSTLSSVRALRGLPFHWRLISHFSYSDQKPSKVIADCVFRPVYNSTHKRFQAYEDWWFYTAVYIYLKHGGGNLRT